MHLLWLTENYPPSQGGMAQSCDRIVKNLRSLGVAVDVLHFTDRVQPFKPKKQHGGHYYAVPRHVDASHSLNVALSYIEHHLPVSDYHGMVAFGGHYPVLAAPVFSKLLSLPLHLAFRGNDFDVALFDSKRRNSLNDAIFSAKTVFVNSRQKQQRIRKLFDHDDVRYSPSGIDAQDWSALPSEIEFAQQWRSQNTPTKKTVIGMLGFMKRKKGVSFFLSAIQQSGADVHVLLSGDQPESIIDALHGMNITHNIIPTLNRYDLLKYYLACDWLAIPSYYEGMPNAMLEAGALGVPVIASDVDGMRDVIKDNVSGLLYRPMDLTDCADKISQAVACAAAARADMGKALEQHVMQLTPTKEAQIFIDGFLGESRGQAVADKIQLHTV